jgi:putative ABC transport system substrate-binding protein
MAIGPRAGAAERVLVLKSQNSPQINEALEGFRSVCDEPLHELDLRGKTDRKNDVLEAIREIQPTIVVAFGPQAAVTALANVGKLPLVFAMVPDPQKRGLHGSNIAGISLNIPAFVQFTNYTNLLLNVKRIGVIYDERKTGELVKEAQATAGKMGLELVAISISSEKAVKDALNRLLAQNISALWMIPDETVVTPVSFEFLRKETSKNKIPFLAASDIFVQQGALAGLSVDYKDLGRQASEMVRRILKDGQPDGRLEAPAKVNLAVNRQTARQLGAVINEATVNAASKTY